ncbi:hypothetical protein HYH03_005480 [Edaphochlamys debaryana]|uniref:Uncharacterized protein n=1 Tax=Edaphochlamys debaryana TaxID=47281 RepID=A0A836C1E3_9CHLO|nr:hypothetical protein HYH03_005480 [Edaphochlamys debaryana]|eukprot:KAG2496660.1 hypothetical protein HYH03_005480 [Edaphochlamys debaryana]
MPSRALGPRLPLLDLDFCVFELSEEEPEGAGPGAGPKVDDLLARCDVEGYNDNKGNDRVSVKLRCGPAGGGAGGAGSSASGAAGGGGAGRGGLAAPPLPYSVLARRALRRMVPSGPWSVIEGQAAQQGALAAASGASGSAALPRVGGDIGACELLLRGAAVAAFADSPDHFDHWVKQLAREDDDAPDGGQLAHAGMQPGAAPLEAVQYLGPVRATVVRCSSAAVRDRVGAAARGPSCEALPVAVPLYEAISQALQAACDGVEEGGPGGGAGDMERLHLPRSYSVELGALLDLDNIGAAGPMEVGAVLGLLVPQVGLGQLLPFLGGLLPFQAGLGNPMLGEEEEEEGFFELPAEEVFGV